MSIINNTIGKCNKSMDFCLKNNDKVISGNSVPNYFMNYFSSLSNNVVSGANPHLNDVRSFPGNKNTNSFPASELDQMAYIELKVHPLTQFIVNFSTRISVFC